MEAFQPTVGEGLRDLPRAGPFAPAEVRDGEGRPQDALDGSLGEREPAGRGAKERARVGVEGAVAGELSWIEVPVELAAAGDLDLAGPRHPGADRSAGPFRVVRIPLPALASPGLPAASSIGSRTMGRCRSNRSMSGPETRAW